MKKVLFAAALAATMVGFTDGIESSNICGYQSMALTPGKQVMKGAMFVTVAQNGLNLQDIVMDKDTPADGGTALWWWDKDTRTYTTAYWVDLYDADGNEVGAKGWGDGENWVAMEKMFKSGEGFWVQAPSDASTPGVTIAGELVTCSKSIASLAYDLTPGKQEQVTNPFPVGEFDVQTVSMDSATPSDGGTALWWWDMDTRKYTTAYWVDLYDSEGNDLGAKGWGDGENWVAMPKTFSAGEAFWIQAPSDATAPQAVFANPLYEEK